VLKKIKSSLKGLLSPKLLLIPALIAMSLWVVALTPQAHEDYIRGSVGDNVYRILQNDSGQSGGGTGFAVKAPSGKSYILTNAHICEMYNGGDTALIESHDGRLIPRKIIERSKTTDLCLIEGLPGKTDGLALASDVSAGENISIVGHPKLMDLTVSKGSVIQFQTIQMLKGIIGQDGLTAEQCESEAKNHVEEVDSLFGKATLCITTLDSLQTTAVSLPGNSGSPAVNFYGHVVGVLFAGDDEVHWGLIIPLDTVQDFLSAY
jgi:S1-C subfamily serine protease